MKTEDKRESRMSISTQETYLPTQQKGMTQTQIEKTLQTIADGFRVWPRSPILHWPEEEGLEYEDVRFPSQDGVPLEGWFIPTSGSNKIIIANHPRWFNRSGLPSHLEPWKSLGAADLVLSDEDLAAIEEAIPAGAAAGNRYPSQHLAALDSER